MKYKTGLKRIQKMLKAIEGTDIRKIYYGRSGLNIGLTRRIKDEDIKKEIEKHKKDNRKATRRKKKDRELEKRKNIMVVESQSVGIFRDRIPSSGKILSRKGSKVFKGQKLAVIESMNVLKDIISPASGKIKEKFVKNTQPVEFGQKLFEIEKEK